MYFISTAVYPELFHWEQIIKFRITVIALWKWLFCCYCRFCTQTVWLSQTSAPNLKLALYKYVSEWHHSDCSLVLFVQKNWNADHTLACSQLTFACPCQFTYCTSYLSINWSNQAQIISAPMQKSQSHFQLFQDSRRRDRQNFGWNSSHALIPYGNHINPTPQPSAPNPKHSPFLSPPWASFDVPTLINSSGTTDVQLTRDNHRNLNRYISPDITVAFLSWQR